MEDCQVEPLEGHLPRPLPHRSAPADKSGKQPNLILYN